MLNDNKDVLPLEINNLMSFFPARIEENKNEFQVVLKLAAYKEMYPFKYTPSVLK